MKSLNIESLKAVYDALQSDVLEPHQACQVIITSLGLIPYTTFNEDDKETVLNEVLRLEKYIKRFNKLPFAFGQKSEYFTIEELYKVEDYLQEKS